ncbi:MAG: aminotransferase class I/II-fold pyridoxal phosphate-dependent enzyme [Candidatus Woesearchaeota archaeon]|nr:aminotransferase class I/II-fold pyridoxal phosphate-dependent enzyme [Candidatus Woesearchaeota archaeon]
MQFKPSDKLASIGTYAFVDVKNEVAKLKKEGVSVIDFGVGDPKNPAPEIAREACKKAVDFRKGAGYPLEEGSAEYREAIAKWTKKRFNASLDPAKEISANIGAKEAVFHFPFCFINPGDYVLIPNPGYPPYQKGTLFAGGKSYFMPLLKENRFLPDLDAIPSEIVKKSKIIWVNYPNNPTTALAGRDFYKKLIDFGHDNNIIIASDECYSEIYFDQKPMSILELGREGVAVFQSLSKRSAMTCYRIGWLAGDENIIAQFKKLKPNYDSGAATFIQDAAIAALSDEKHVEEMRKDYKIKRDIMIDAFNSIGLEKCMPEATLYMWQKAPKGMKSLDFAKALLRKEIAVVTTPGSWISENFNNLNPGEGYVRFALVPSIEDCKKAAERIKKLSF